jgi:ubiquitin-protein ligase
MILISLDGNKYSEWEGTKFELIFEFQNYPLSPPNVKFLTKMFHPNISEDGSVKISILNSGWKPIYNI